MERPRHPSVLREHRAILALGFTLCLFLALAALTQTELLRSRDLAVTKAVQSRRTPALDVAATGVTMLGSWPALATAVLIGAGLCVAAGKPLAASLAVATLSAYPLNHLLKTLVGRPRPGEGVEVLQKVSGLSFPSGHSMTSAAVLGFLAFLSWTYIPHPRLRRCLTFLLALSGLLIGVSRIYLGAHWLSDVVAGWTVGLCLALLFAELYKSRAGAELTARRPDCP